MDKRYTILAAQVFTLFVVVTLLVVAMGSINPRSAFKLPSPTLELVLEVDGCKVYRLEQKSPSGSTLHFITTCDKRP